MRRSVLISLLCLRPGQIGGTETLVRKIVAALPRNDDGIEYSLLVPEHLASEFNSLGFRMHAVDLNDAQLVRHRFLEATTPFRSRKLEQLIASLNPDLIWFPQLTLFPKRVTVPSVVTVNDLQHIRFPQNFPWPDRIFRWGIYGYSLIRAQHVVPISQQTATELRDNYELDPARISVIRLGHDDQKIERQPLANWSVDPFYYYPAASYPHKNHAALIRSVGQLVQENRWKTKIVLSGQQTSHWNSIRQLVEKLGLRDLVEHVGFRTPEEVAWLFDNAKGILFPSLYEGFGLPVVEAATFGQKLLASDLPIYDELGLPPENRVDFSDADELRTRLDQVPPVQLATPPPTWQQVAEAYHELFCRALESTNGPANANSQHANA